MVLVALLTVVTTLAGCSDLGNQADATVKIQAADMPQAMRLRQDLLDQASAWGGVRVGERSTEQDGDVSLTFSLPGRNLDAALGSINHLGVDVDSTDIDVDRSDVDRSATTSAPARTSSGQSDGQIRLRVQIATAPAAGFGAVFRLVMAVFSLVGMVATVLWVRNVWQRRSSRRSRAGRGPRTIVDISDPPTEETPIVGRDPW